MNVISTKPAGFQWSWSKLKNYETCPLRYAEVDLHKTTEQETSQELDRGDQLHKAMYSRVMNDTPLPAHFIYMEKWAERLTKEISPYQIINCELKLALDRNYKPTGFFDRTTWVRAKIDYFRLIPSLKVQGVDIGHVVDYKTGKPREDGGQLALAAFMIFAHYVNLQSLRVEYLWTEYNDTSHQDFHREDMDGVIEKLLPRVTTMEAAHVAGRFDPRPCGLCKDYCPVSKCEHWGKRPYRG